MQAVRLLAKLIIYYAVVGLLLAATLWLFPDLGGYLPIGRVHALLAENGGQMHKGLAGIKVAHIDTIGGSLIWLVSAMVGALLTALPVSWTYMEVRDREQYDQSLIGTIVMLPIVITSIVVIVQDSLALSFSLAGIIGAVRFRNSLKSTGDLLFTLLAIAIGISAGIGAMELAAVTSIMFNLCFVILWATEYGERKSMKRFLADYRPDEEDEQVRTTEVVVAAMTVTETMEKPAS
jgi:hypothetical protein